MTSAFGVVHELSKADPPRPLGFTPHDIAEGVRPSSATHPLLDAVHFSAGSTHEDEHLHRARLAGHSEQDIHAAHTSGKNFRRKMDEAFPEFSAHHPTGPSGRPSPAAAAAAAPRVARRIHPGVAAGVGAGLLAVGTGTVALHRHRKLHKSSAFGIEHGDIAKGEIADYWKHTPLKVHAGNAAIGGLAAGAVLVPLAAGVQTRRAMKRHKQRARQQHPSAFGVDHGRAAA